MARLLKFLVFASVLAAVTLVVYAYVGPLLGADFTPPIKNVVVPVEIDLE